PGPGAIYISQSLNFKRPVKIGDTITARVKLKQLNQAKQRVHFACVCENQDGKAVLDGEAELMVPSRS
ncbi:MAG: hotdog domain-containing protein, partial [Pseudomonadota bacterium]